MIFIENIWEEYVCLNHVMKIWMEQKEQHIKILVKYVDGSEDEMAVFREEEKAKKYILRILDSYGEIKVLEHKEAQ